MSFVFGLILLIIGGWLSLARVQEPESAWILTTIGMYDPYLVRVNADGSGLKQLTTQDQFAFLSDAHWSEQGDRIMFTAFKRPVNMIGYIYQINPHGTTLENMTPSNFDQIYDAYQTSNDDIFISGKLNGEGFFSIYRFDSKTNHLESITPLDGHATNLRQSPDSNWLLFQIDSTFYRIKRDGSQLAPLPNCLYHITIYSWSPDSQYLPCKYIRNGITHLSLLNIETLEITLIKQFENQIFYLTWSPDGEWLIFMISPYREYNKLFKIRIDGSDLTQITYPEYAAEGESSWSPDGQWIAFFRYTTEHYSLYKVRPDGSDEQWLGDLDFTHTPPLWSPIIDYGWHDKHLLGIGSVLMFLSLFPMKKSLFCVWNKLL